MRASLLAKAIASLFLCMRCDLAADDKRAGIIKANQVKHLLADIDAEGGKDGNLTIGCCCHGKLLLG